MITLSIGLITEKEDIPPKRIQVAPEDRMELIIFNSFGCFNPDFVVLCGDTEIWSAGVLDLDISHFDNMELMVYDRKCEKYKVLMELRKAYKNATDKMAQFFVKTPMIHVALKINGEPFKALVDTGAQLSIISEAAAKRARIWNLLDRRFHVDAQGIGGFQKALGKVLDVELEIGGCLLGVVLTIFEEGPMENELILGVDVLTAYGAGIDFKNRKISFNGEVEVSMI